MTAASSRLIQLTREAKVTQRAWLFESARRLENTLTSDSGVESVQIRECEGHRAKVHHDPVHVSAVFVDRWIATRHEDARVTATHVVAARVVQREVQGGVQHTLDRSLNAHVQLPVPHVLDLPREYVIRLTNLAHESRVVSDGRG